MVEFYKAKLADDGFSLLEDVDEDNIYEAMFAESEVFATDLDTPEIRAARSELARIIAQWNPRARDTKWPRDRRA